MANELFDIGVDFALSYFKPLTKQQYRQQDVDYYDQTLNLSTQTGINIPFGSFDDDDDDDESKRKNININIIGGIGTEGEDSNIFNRGTVANIPAAKIGTYGETLSKSGFKDKNPFNIFGTDIYFAGVPRTKQDVKEGFEKLISKEKLIEQGIRTGARFAGLPTMMTSTALGFATGKGVPDALGNMNFRPSHAILGGIFDINNSIQYDDIRNIQNAMADSKQQKSGFAMYFDGQLVTRSPNSTKYTGNIGNRTIEQIRRSDALSKGYIPLGYNVQDESGDLGIKDNIGGVYDEKGGYHDRNGSYAYGSRAASQGLANRYGLDVNIVEKVLSDVRSGRTKNNLTAELQKATFESIPVSKEVKQSFQIKNPFEQEDEGSGGSEMSDYGSFEEQYSQDFEPVAMGGQIGQGMQAGGPAGFIGGPPEKFSKQTTIADDIPLEVPEGAFIINAPAVEYAGSDDISKMLTDAYEKAGQGVDKSGQTTTIPSKEQVDIMISRGEVVVPPNIAKIIGYDRLEKINNRGKKEVTNRQKAGDQEKPQARQGFINKASGDKVEEKTLDQIKYKSFYSSPDIARSETEKILRSLPLADALAIMMYEEANVLGNRGLEGVAHVFVNRADATGYKDFGNPLIDELLKRTYTKDRIFQFNALEPTKFRKTLKTFKKDKKIYSKIRNIAEEVIAGARKDFTGGALFFKNPKSSTEGNFAKKVTSGEYVETNRSKKTGPFQHIYYKPKDFTGGVMATKEISKEPFVPAPKTNILRQLKKRIPESRGGSFLFRGSDYERGGATPAF